MLKVVLRWHGRVIGMRMIKAYNIQALPGCFLLSAHQFLRPNQKTIPFCLLFARIRDRIYFGTDLHPISSKTTEQESAAFIRIVSLAMTPNLVFVLGFELDHWL